MNILVTGANGQLGTSIRDITHNSPHNYIFTDVAELDITDCTAVNNIMQREDIDIIINCAAYTNVDAAESEPLNADRINHIAVRNLAQAAHTFDATIIHISTDYVFGGHNHNTPCNENCETAPTGVYGVTKLAGEQAIIHSGCKHIIIRTAWLYSPYGKNFMKTMINLTASREAVNVVFDQVGTPTYAAHLAAAICHIIDNGSYNKHGIYHFSNQGVCSWYDFAHAIASLAGHNNCTINPCYSSDFPSPVKRPAYSVLDKTKFITTFEFNIPHWYDALQECFIALNNNN